ncbi:hypothetical protein ACTAB0_24640 [Pseudomonas syringae]|uniref:hypothetical protein n=1 Tax=Pseudomonas syringae TaxID=317 RepID=UPI003F7B1F9F
MTYKVDEIKALIRSLNWKGLKKKLDLQLVNSELFAEILLLVWQSDSIVRRRPGDDGVKRDRFLNEFGNYFLLHGVDTAISNVQKVRVELLKIDRGYEEIYSATSKVASLALSSEQRVSGVFIAADFALSNLNRDLDHKIRSSKGVLDVGRNVHGVDGNEYDPNSNLHGLTIAVGDVIMLEAYSQGWFNAEGRISLPELPRTDEAIAEAVIANLRNANAWRIWKGVDERVRFLGASLTQISNELHSWKTRVEEDGGPKIQLELNAAFEFKPDMGVELLDTLANERFDTILDQNFRKLLITTNAVEKVSDLASFVELAPKGYVSVDEVHAVLMFSFLTKMDPWKAKSNDLSIVEIIRGYAVLKNFIGALDQKNETHTPRVSRARLHLELTRFGLTSLAANSFIDRATFQRSSRDLYDQPLIKTINDEFFVFGPSLVSANLPKIVFSSLANEGATFEEKGGMYEAATIGMLQGAGFQPRNLKVRRGGDEEQEYDYDVAFTWDDYVFFIECKNRGLPMGNPIAIYRFNNELHDHIKQVKRLKQALLDYPDILEKDFPEAVGKKAIFCLVNALPFAIGSFDGLYIIDDSILGRFFTSPTFGMVAGRLDGKGQVKRIDLKKIWTGSKPTAKEFISYLAEPPQLIMAKKHYEIAPKIEFLSDEVCAKIVDFRRKDLKSKEVSNLLTSMASGLLYNTNAAQKSGRKAAKAKKNSIKASRKARAKNRNR